MQFYSYKRQVPLKPGDRIGYKRGKGYYRVPASALSAPSAPAPAAAMLTLQRTIFWATITDDAVRYAAQLHGWRHALSADAPYAPTSWQVETLKEHSAGVDAWGVQTQIPPVQISQFAATWGLDRVIHQAENPAEAATVHASYVIGNLTLDGLGSLFGELNDRVKQGHLGATTEVYNGRPDSYDTNGFLVSSFTLGVWLDDGKHYSLHRLLELTKPGLHSTVCIWHGTPTLLDEADRAALMTL